MNNTITDHKVQIENPTCSAKIEKTRFRRAIFFPVLSQNPSSSGSQCSIHRFFPGFAVVITPTPSEAFPGCCHGVLTNRSTIVRTAGGSPWSRCSYAGEGGP